MRTTAQMTLRALLKSCSPSEEAALMNHLSPPQKESLEKLAEPYGDPLHDFWPTPDLLNSIHPSWMSSFLRNLSEKDIGLYLAALQPSQSAALKKDLLYSGETPVLTPQGKLYLQQTLLESLTSSIQELVPPSSLPSSPLNILLELKNDQLSLLLDFLGLHDVGLEVRQIIDKQKLKKIYDVLSPAQLTYLKILLQSFEPVTFAPMGLSGWDGDREKLKSLLLQRSANRLAKALYGQHASLIWYILHRINLEQALLVQKLCTPLENPRANSILISQILEFINFTKEVS